MRCAVMFIKKPADRFPHLNVGKLIFLPARCAAAAMVDYSCRRYEIVLVSATNNAVTEVQVFAIHKIVFAEPSN